MTAEKGLRVSIQGIVQGVGFRPFVFGLAEQLNLKGWVRNTSGGVEIEVDGPPQVLEKFLHALEHKAPPLALIDSVQAESCPPDGYQTFEIRRSQAVDSAFQPISPDVSICEDCLRELSDPDDHRYLYPFINCTNCGPRFTIIKDIPYDRPQTTMAPFPMCPVCSEEYHDPRDRRFHAQPVACPDCGPHLTLIEFNQQNADSVEEDQPIVKTEALRKARRLLEGGSILAVKGLGGFHLACRAEDRETVSRLRKRKGRPAKPLAVMMPDLAEVRKHCLVSPEEEDLLTSRKRPIVLLQKRPGSDLPGELAPGQRTLGVMLPYTPLHYLLFQGDGEEPDPDYRVLVMTSGNRSGSPITTSLAEVQDVLHGIPDAALTHNRDIHVPCDDSVIRTAPDPAGRGARPYLLRRSRGYTPYPVLLPEDGPALLGAGGELKNTHCLTRDRYAFLSQHIGNLTRYETLQVYLDSTAHFRDLFRIEIEGIACDAHPDYLATREAELLADRLEVPLFKVQHHHAHIASCLADNGITPERPVIGFAFDGTGYGDDGSIWGGEVLLADYSGYHRAYHLSYFPLPGGDLAVKEPWRTALAALKAFELPWEDHLAPVCYARKLTQPGLAAEPLDILKAQLASGTNVPLTSSLGRLFDAVSALCGVRQRISYEGQAAIEFEAQVDPEERGAYPFRVTPDGLIDPGPVLEAVLEDLSAGQPVPAIAGRFHNGLAAWVREVSRRIRDDHDLHEVALSGGVWQNLTLLKSTLPLLEEDGFIVYTHDQVPANDGGLALGQAAVGRHLMIT